MKFTFESKPCKVTMVKPKVSQKVSNNLLKTNGKYLVFYSLQSQFILLSSALNLNPITFIN